MLLTVFASVLRIRYKIIQDLAVTRLQMRILPTIGRNKTKQKFSIFSIKNFKNPKVNPLMKLILKISTSPAMAHEFGS